MIPEYTREAIDRYVRKRDPAGGFVTAILAGDLYRAVNNADGPNTAAFVEIVKYAWNHVPADALGSYAKVEAWINGITEERGVAGDRCEVGNECGRTGCPECQS